MTRLLIFLSVVVAAWPTPQPTPQIPAPLTFPTVSLPQVTVMPVPPPSLPTPSIASTPVPTPHSTYTDTKAIMEGVISAADETITEFNEGVDEMEGLVGLSEGQGDWDPGWLTGTTTSGMVYTITVNMGRSLAFLKGISYIGSGESQMGLLVIFLIIGLAWIGLILSIGILVKVINWLIDFATKVLDAIPIIG